MVAALWVSLHEWNLHLARCSGSGSTTTATCSPTRDAPASSCTRSTTSSATCRSSTSAGWRSRSRSTSSCAVAPAARRLLPARRHELGRRGARLAVAAQPRQRRRQHGARRRRHRRGPAGGPTRAWAMPSIILASAWKDLGFVMVILLAGLQSITRDLYEAARVDGAGWWRRLFARHAPAAVARDLLRVVISLINGFQVFDQVYVMTGRRPGRRRPGRRAADLRPHLPLRPGGRGIRAVVAALRRHPRSSPSSSSAASAGG